MIKVLNIAFKNLYIFTVFIFVHVYHVSISKKKETHMKSPIHGAMVDSNIYMIVNLTLEALEIRQK